MIVFPLICKRFNYFLSGFRGGHFETLPPVINMERALDKGSQVIKCNKMTLNMTPHKQNDN